MSDKGELGSAPGGPGSIAAANRVPEAGTKGIASGGLGNNDPAGSSLAGKGTPVMPGGGTGTADLQPGTEDGTGMSGGATNDAMPGGGATDDPASTADAKPAAP